MSDDEIRVNVDVDQQTGMVTVTAPGWQVDVIPASSTWTPPVGVRAVDVLAAAGAGAPAGDLAVDGSLGAVQHKSVEVDGPVQVEVGAGGAGSHLTGGRGVVIVLSRW